MSKKSEAVKRWRRNTKRKLILVMGDKCVICGYNKCDDIFEFHHINPLEKDVNWGQIRANIKSFESILKEMKKCILLCSNCHKEIHSELIDTKIPKDVKLLTNEDIEKLLNGTHECIPKTPCVVCGNMKPEWQNTCSKSCGYDLMNKRKIDWSHIDVLEMYKKMSFGAMAEQLNCSSGAISKRMKKIDPTGELRKKIYLDKQIHKQIIVKKLTK